MRRATRSILRAVRWTHLLRTLAIPLIVLLPGAARAHDIPASVVVQAFVRPQGETLRLLVRVPAAARQGSWAPTSIAPAGRSRYQESPAVPRP